MNYHGKFLFLFFVFDAALFFVAGNLDQKIISM